MSEDGAYLLSCSQDGLAFLTEIATGAVHRVSPDVVAAVAFTDDGVATVDGYGRYSDYPMASLV